MSSRDVSFAPRLAAVAGDKEKTGASAIASTSPPSRLAVIARVAVVALLVAGLGLVLHWGTESKRDQERRDQIERVLELSGVDRGAPNANQAGEPK